MENTCVAGVPPAERVLAHSTGLLLPRPHYHTTSPRTQRRYQRYSTHVLYIGGGVVPQRWLPHQVSLW